MGKNKVAYPYQQRSKRNEQAQAANCPPGMHSRHRPGKEAPKMVSETIFGASRDCARSPRFSAVLSSFCIGSAQLLWREMQALAHRGSIFGDLLLALAAIFVGQTGAEGSRGEGRKVS